jgi:hypothetical protein
MTSKSEQQILLQHVMALKRLAKIGSPLYGNTPTHEQIDTWAKELENYIKQKDLVLR